ncbi:hypothetical protein AC1031_000063 [Aphanomyces cochlioides]|nr:hypothetical protein AC1031_000063 [Aphanomyces cochlioides]
MEKTLAGLALVRTLRPRSLTREERLDVLQLICYLRNQGEKDVSGKVAAMLGRGERTVKSVWSDYVASGNVVPVPPPSNASNHTQRVPSNPAVLALVQTFIRDRSIKRERTVAKDIVTLLQQHGHVTIKPNDKKDEASCLRAVQQFLIKQGYERGKRSGQTPYRLSAAHLLACDTYIEYMVAVVQLAPKTPVVYIDESFIHHHYSRHNHSLYDPEDDVETKPKHKGRRYCFIAVFVMDNAKYHKSKPPSTPSGKWMKEQMLDACRDYGILVSASDLRSTIWARLKEYISTNVSPMVVDLARSRGHDVVYTAPGYSELQPIEMVWAKMKGDVGCKNHL